MRKWIVLFLLGVVGALSAFGLISLLFFLLLNPIFSIDGKHTYTLDEIGQAIHSPIPADATDIQFSSETHYGYYIKLSFKAPPESTLSFAKHICGETLYQGYDPFTASDSFASKTNTVIVKWAGYAYFSHSNASQGIYGNRCQLKSNPFNAIQVKIDQTNSSFYQVRFELLEDSCAIKVTCSGYSLEGAAHHPLPKNSPIPLIAYGFEENDQYSLRGHQVCLETDPGLFYDWDKPPFNLDDFKGASFELFVDGMSKGQATISDQGRLKVDYSTGKFIGLHEPPEYCFQVDAIAGTHQMSVDVKTVAGKSYHYSWDFRIKA